MVGVLAVPAGGQKTKTREFCAVHGSQGKRGAPCYFTPDRSQHAACIGDIAMADWCVGKVTSRPGFISLVIDHECNKPRRLDVVAFGPKRIGLVSMAT